MGSRVIMPKKRGVVLQNNDVVTPHNQFAHISSILRAFLGRTPFPLQHRSQSVRQMAVPKHLNTMLLCGAFKQPSSLDPFPLLCLFDFSHFCKGNLPQSNLPLDLIALPLTLALTLHSSSLLTSLNNPSSSRNSRDVDFMITRL